MKTMNGLGEAEIDKKLTTVSKCRPVLRRLLDDD